MNREEIKPAKGEMLPPDLESALSVSLRKLYPDTCLVSSSGRISRPTSTSTAVFLGVLFALERDSDGGYSGRLSNGRIADRCPVGAGAISVHTRLLQACGWLTIVKIRGRSAQYYTICVAHVLADISRWRDLKLRLKRDAAANEMTIKINKAIEERGGTPLDMPIPSAEPSPPAGFPSAVAKLEAELSSMRHWIACNFGLVADEHEPIDPPA